jgi:hypothetical protein
VLYAGIKRGNFVPGREDNMACRCETKKVVPEKNCKEQFLKRRKKNK